MVTWFSVPFQLPDQLLKLKYWFAEASIVTRSPALYEPEVGFTNPPFDGEAVTDKVYFTISGGALATSLSFEQVVSIIKYLASFSW